MIHDGMQYDPIQGQGHARAFQSWKSGSLQKLTPPPFTMRAGNWPRILKLGHNMSISKFDPAGFLIFGLVCVTWLWSWHKRQLRRVYYQSAYGADFLLVILYKLQTKLTSGRRILTEGRIARHAIWYLLLHTQTPNAFLYWTTHRIAPIPSNTWFHGLWLQKMVSHWLYDGIPYQVKRGRRSGHHCRKHVKVTAYWFQWRYD